MEIALNHTLVYSYDNIIYGRKGLYFKDPNGHVLEFLTF